MAAGGAGVGGHDVLAGDARFGGERWDRGRFDAHLPGDAPDGRHGVAEVCGIAAKAEKRLVLFNLLSAIELNT